MWVRSPRSSFHQAAGAGLGPGAARGRRAQPGKSSCLGLVGVFQASHRLPCTLLSLSQAPRLGCGDPAPLSLVPTGCPTTPTGSKSSRLGRLVSKLFSFPERTQKPQDFSVIRRKKRKEDVPMEIWG